MSKSVEIAIVGAGVIGLTIAEALIRAGREVVLIDPNPAGSGASYGNAGTIADYAVMPVGTPDVLRDLPRLLFDKHSPLAIRRAGILALMPWLARFAVQSLPRAAATNARAISQLLDGAASHWGDLAARIGGGDILQPKGCLYLYERAADYHAASKDMAARRAMGVQVELIDADAVRQLEPNLPPVHGGAAYFPNAVFMSDPAAMMHRLAAHVAQSAEIICARADTIARHSDRVVVTGQNLNVVARKVIIAAGAHSRALAAMAGSRVPLDTERGYHVEWDMDAPRLTRPTCPTARGFYLCPMTGRLRVVGTVELGGLSAPPSQHRIDALIAGARDIFPDLGTPDRVWMGFRPSMPDSRPVIGPSRGGDDVILAFGHGHIGLTLAPKTAEIVADLIAGRAVDLAPCNPFRF